MNRKKICWKITSNCNQGCKYCFRLLNSEDLSFDENKKILMNLIEDGVTDITWNGGEALLYPHIFDLFKIAKENGIRNKLITNGKLLLKDNNFENIQKYVDNLTISLDTINSKTNLELGGDEFYLQNVKNILEYSKLNRNKNKY